ncbi:hypothetical protein BDB00DRAFT_387577 [Zychaea mexicana]|uniref:uncharacterized protein n=1 Tax=Zychaea mexicana TaxID=64656 RepID=UPI0022FE64F8|nr:uncharacterized protein BDB00DRAFT_387577 [Zychaea mexicana]KAI9493165.1 hypothetical protein BDB00DRAFT_387577 [Zychaea mexicana]
MLSFFLRFVHTLSHYTSSPLLLYYIFSLFYRLYTRCRTHSPVICLGTFSGVNPFSFLSKHFSNPRSDLTPPHLTLGNETNHSKNHKTFLACFKAIFFFALTHYFTYSLTHTSPRAHIHSLSGHHLPCFFMTQTSSSYSPKHPTNYPPFDFCAPPLPRLSPFPSPKKKIKFIQIFG